MERAAINLFLWIATIISFVGTIGEKDKDTRKELRLLFIFSTFVLVVFNSI